MDVATKLLSLERIDSMTHGINGQTVIDGETGLLVPPEAPAALAEAILTLIGDPASAEAMAANARRRADDTFRWTAYVDAYHARIRALGKE